IVIPLDGSALAERIIEPAAKLGKAAGAAYSLLLVLDKSSTLGGAASEAAQNQAAAYLGRIVHRLRAESLLVDADVIQAAKAAEAILEFVAQRGNPVIALATHGRSGLQRLILGSVADKIIRGATMPVLIYHPMEKT
ncbi:MAG: universal stress protein, partial [Planctomycetes bacterium]|nr:universal stress protein [Planctomycetota bacterium]